MKKIFCTFLSFIILSFCLNVSAKEIYFQNDNGIIFTKDEYNFISNIFYEGYQNLMTKEDYENIFNENNYLNGKIEKNQLDEKIMPLSAIYETGSKKITLSKSCTSECLVSIVVEWKKSPIVRSYDLIGARLENTKLIIQPVTKATNSVGVSYPENTKNFENGFGTIIKLLPSGDDIKISQYFTVAKGGVVYGSYQHAKKAISLANSQKFTLSYLGYGNVFLFDSMTIKDYYDGMAGVSLSL